MGFPEETNETLQHSYELMNEIQLDIMQMFTVIPFPGTSLFNQAVKDNLLIGNWNMDDLWKTPISHAVGEFLIKPYNMEIEDLRKWRKKFDNIRLKFWEVNPKMNIYHGQTTTKKDHKWTEKRI